jgi:hypothetical protein
MHMSISIALRHGSASFLEMLNLNTRTQAYRTGYNDAYQDANVLRGRRFLTNATPEYRAGYEAAWKIYGV